jgi:hypothetical protein
MKRKSGVEGERHGMSRLTRWQVKDIFERAHTERHKVLAKEYNIHPTTVTNIKGGLSWRHLNLRNMSKDGTPPLTP